MLSVVLARLQRRRRSARGTDATRTASRRAPRRRSARTSRSERRGRCTSTPIRDRSSPAGIEGWHYARGMKRHRVAGPAAPDHHPHPQLGVGRRAPRWRRSPRPTRTPRRPRSPAKSSTASRPSSTSWPASATTGSTSRPAVRSRWTPFRRSIGVGQHRPGQHRLPRCHGGLRGPARGSAAGDRSGARPRQSSRPHPRSAPPSSAWRPRRARSAVGARYVGLTHGNARLTVSLDHGRASISRVSPVARRTETMNLVPRTALAAMPIAVALTLALTVGAAAQVATLASPDETPSRTPETTEAVLEFEDRERGHSWRSPSACVTTASTWMIPGLRHGGGDAPSLGRGGGQRRIRPSIVARRSSWWPRACGAILEASRPEIDPEAEQERLEEQLQLAQCIRDNGYPEYPDPAIGSDGRLERVRRPGLRTRSGSIPARRSSRRSSASCRYEIGLEGLRLRRRWLRRRQQRRQLGHDETPRVRPRRGALRGRGVRRAPTCRS